MEKWKSKAIWTGIGALLLAAGGYLSGNLSGPEALQAGLIGLVAIFLRLGIFAQQAQPPPPGP